jgi:Fibronectin type III domain
MKRFLLFVMLAAFSTVGLVTPASAASRQPPSAPRDVLVAQVGPAGSVQLSWKAPQRLGGAAVKGYRITWVQQPKASPERVRLGSAKARSTVLTGLKPGGSYLAKVAAYSRFGQGPWSKVSFTVAASATHTDQLFAVDTEADTLVRLPLAGGTESTVLTGVTDATDLATDPAGNAYLANNGSVTKVPVDGSAPITVGPGFQVETDQVGNAYLLSSGGIAKVTPAGQTTTTPGTGGGVLAVSRDGIVKTVGAAGETVYITTYPTGGGTPDVQTVSVDGRMRAALDDDRGNVYVNETAVGGSDSTFWELIQPGATSASDVSGRPAEYGVAAGPDGQFYLASSTSFCFAHSEDFGTCTPDRNVTEIQRFPVGGGTPVSVPITGLQTSRYTTMPLAVDANGAIFAAPAGSTPGIVRYPATGGAPTRLTDGQYELLTIG